jgi:hypothetical protein
MKFADFTWICGMILLLASAPVIEQNVTAATPKRTSIPTATTHARTTGTNGCTIKSVKYKGWRATQLSNKWVTLEIVPQIGGRLIQVTFDGHDLLYINPQFVGQVIPPGPRGFGDHNYGGDKVNPLPEGNRDEQHWSGNGGHIDYAPSELKVMSRAPNDCAVRLTEPSDDEVGQRYIRDISIGAYTPLIHFHNVMENTSGFPQSWSEQTITEFAVSEPAGTENLNKSFYGVTEINAKSTYPDKPYHVRTGPQDNPAFEVKDGTLRVHWNDIMEEVWIDSPSGWLAAVNGETAYTVVMRHDIDHAHAYPGDASIIFYSSGPPRRRGGNSSTSANQSSQREGPFMEAEVNSPMVELKPGETYALDTSWYLTRMDQSFKTTTWSGVIGQALQAKRRPDGIALTGDFGVFYHGTLVAHIYSRTQEDKTMKVMEVTPTEEVHLQMTIAAPSNATRVSIHLVDDQGVDRGPLGEVVVDPPLPRQVRQQ